MFKNVLIGLYGEKKKEWEKEKLESYQYTIPHDYRIVELEGVQEINEETKNALSSTGVTCELKL